MPQSNNAAAFPDSKKHFEILDALRGIAAIMVVIFHVFETHAKNRFEQTINHGYLAVDFFYVLSGFVVGYAYNDRWNKLTVNNFFKRRLIRLHPMVVMGMIIGAVLFYRQACAMWPSIAQTPISSMLLIMLIGFTLIPVPVSMDIRGWQEMHPLNGPGWSLFFEYIANILYALWIRKFSNKALMILVAIAGIALIHLTVFGKNGDVIGGWSITGEQIYIGLCRLMYPFFSGLLLSRLAIIKPVKSAFLICSALIIFLLSFPRLGDDKQLWLNGIYESVVIIVFFPLIVYLGAGGTLKNMATQRIAKFLGDISYPIYITHYPLIYWYTAWVSDNKVPFSKAYPYAGLLLVSAIGIAYLCLILYDLPVRKWLTKKFIYNK